MSTVNVNNVIRTKPGRNSYVYEHLKDTGK